MKIAVFAKSTTLHKNYGGLETQNRALCEELTKRGHEITIFSPKRDFEGNDAFVNGVKYVFIDAEYGNYLLSSLKKNSWIKKSLEVFEEFHRNEKFDLVLGQSSAAESIIENKRNLDIKTASISHGTALSELITFFKNISGIKDIYWLLRNTQYFLRQYFGRQRRFVLHSDVVIAVSNYVKKSLMSETFVDDKKVKVIHNGVDGSLFKNEKTEKDRKHTDIYFIGRVEKSKGIITIIKMMKDINRDVKLHVVGDGPCLEEAKKKAEDLNIKDRIIFYGKMPHYEFIKKISPDIFVFPTKRIEGFPMVLVESMFFGIPVVAFDMGGVSDAVENGKNGFLIESGNVSLFKEKLVELIDDKTLRSDMGNYAKEKAEKEFTIGKMIDAYEKVFLDILK